jgi:catechol 2,3-dioxygenase
MTTKLGSGPRISHLVVNVGDLDASHEFYTRVLGFEQCGELRDGNRLGRMRFYRGGADRHHDLALVQTKEELVDHETWTILQTRMGINHIAIAYPDRDAWLARIEHIQGIGVEFLVRGDHGMTHSAYIQDPDGNGIEVVYDLPESVWSGDVNAALNYFDGLPTTGAEALDDNINYVIFEPVAGD